MIDWKNIKDLHVNKKLEQVIGKWFGVDIFYTDKHGNIHGDLENNDFESHFFKLQFSLPHGQQILSQDIEKGIELVENADKQCYYFDSFFPHVRVLAAKIEVDGE